jgi:hypothetical protein
MKLPAGRGQGKTLGVGYHAAAKLIERILIGTHGCAPPKRRRHIDQVQLVERR